MGLLCSLLKMVLLNMMANAHPLTIVSYNSRGFAADRQAYIRTLLSKCSILCVQEHWLADSQLPLLGSLDPYFSYAGVSGFGNDEVLSGRPYGGCAILWRNDIHARVQILDVSKRISAVRLYFTSFCTCPMKGRNLELMLNSLPS